MGYAGESRLLSLNCGSSSIKFGLFEASASGVRRTPVWTCRVEGLDGPTPTFACGDTDARALPRACDNVVLDALVAVRAQLDLELQGDALLAMAHRVVHGSTKHMTPVVVDRQVLDALRGCKPLAPLHQPPALDAIEALLNLVPEVPQVACFDTAFHQTMPLAEKVLPLPRAVWDRGLQRYGFHGLSYAYQAIVLNERYGTEARGRVIVAHLGSGASLCAMKDLQSVSTTMGFSALDGLMMGTRCGTLDPGVLLHLLQVDGMRGEELSHMLYQQSGLLGVSGISADPRVLLAQEEVDERAGLALDMYVRRIVREIGGLTAVLGGLDMLVFTAGVGEHNADIRDRICGAFGYLGMVLDDPANRAHARTISSGASAVRVLVEPAAEEWVAAQHAWALMQSNRGPP